MGPLTPQWMQANGWVGVSVRSGRLPIRPSSRRRSSSRLRRAALFPRLLTLGPDEQGLAIQAMLDLPGDIGLPDPRPLVPEMVRIHRRHPKLNLLNLEAAAAACMLAPASSSRPRPPEACSPPHPRTPKASVGQPSNPRRLSLRLRCTMRERPPLRAPPAHFSGAVLASPLAGGGVYGPRPPLFGGSYGSRSSSSCLAARAAREATSALLSSSRAAARSLSSSNRGLETSRMSGLS